MGKHAHKVNPMAHASFNTLFQRMEKLCVSLGMAKKRKRGLMPDEIFRLAEALVELASDAMLSNEWCLAHNILTTWAAFALNVYTGSRAINVHTVQVRDVFLTMDPLQPLGFGVCLRDQLVKMQRIAGEAEADDTKYRALVARLNNVFMCPAVAIMAAMYLGGPELETAAAAAAEPVYFMPDDAEGEELDENADLPHIKFAPGAKGAFVFPSFNGANLPSSTSSARSPAASSGSRR